MTTICAISTPFGVGGLAVIRVSGPDAIAIVESLFSSPLACCKTGTAIHGFIRDLDEVICTVFRAPHSFTGEDTVEISCHGSLFIQQEMLRLLIHSGCHQAQPGEFTRRAFLNGKLDLTQAEAVADLIAAQSKAEKDLALNHLKGGVSSRLEILRDQLLHLTSLLELELDFADHEDLEFVNRSELQTIAANVLAELSALIDSFHAGNAIRNGIAIAIVGAPNAGKSTLLNALLGEERAIVSDIAGTTRDTIEDQLIIGGQLFRLIDTAGIRSATDQIEQLGVVRARRAITNAHIVLEIIDATAPEHILSSADLSPQQEHLMVYNKSDLLDSQPPIGNESHTIAISAKLGQMQPLLDYLASAAQRLTTASSAVMISNVRHYEALVRAQQAMQRVEQGLLQSLSGELITPDLHECTDALGEITGAITSQDVLSNIFKNFCIGK